MRLREKIRGILQGDSKGQSIVEFTLMLPLLLILAFIPVDFSLAFLSSHLLQNAVREGARIATTQSPVNATTIQTEVLNRLPIGLLTNRNVTVTQPASANGLTNSSGAICDLQVTVTGEGDYSFFFLQLMRLLGFPTPASIHITRAVAMRYEAQPLCT